MNTNGFIQNECVFFYLYAIQSFTIIVDIDPKHTPHQSKEKPAIIVYCNTI